jgi:hypothetical protein
MAQVHVLRDMMAGRAVRVADLATFLAVLTATEPEDESFWKRFAHDVLAVPGSALEQAVTSELLVGRGMSRGKLELVEGLIDAIQGGEPPIKRAPPSAAVVATSAAFVLSALIGGGNGGDELGEVFQLYATEAMDLSSRMQGGGTSAADTDTTGPDEELGGLGGDDDDDDGLPSTFVRCSDLHSVVLTLLRCVREQCTVQARDAEAESNGQRCCKDLLMHFQSSAGRAQLEAVVGGDGDGTVILDAFADDLRAHLLQLAGDQYIEPSDISADLSPRSPSSPSSIQPSKKQKKAKAKRRKAIAQMANPELDSDEEHGDGDDATTGAEQVDLRAPHGLKELLRYLSSGPPSSHSARDGPDGLAAVLYIAVSKGLPRSMSRTLQRLCVGAVLGAEDVANLLALLSDTRGTKNAHRLERALSNYQDLVAAVWDPPQAEGTADDTADLGHSPENRVAATLRRLACGKSNSASQDEIAALYDIAKHILDPYWLGNAGLEGLFEGDWPEYSEAKEGTKYTNPQFDDEQFISNPMDEDIAFVNPIGLTSRMQGGGGGKKEKKGKSKKDQNNSSPFEQEQAQDNDPTSPDSPTKAVKKKKKKRASRKQKEAATALADAESHLQTAHGAHDETAIAAAEREVQAATKSIDAEEQVVQAQQEQQQAATIVTAAKRRKFRRKATAEDRSGAAIEMGVDEAQAAVDEAEIVLAAATTKKNRKQAAAALAAAQTHLETARVAHDESATIEAQQEVEAATKASEAEEQVAAAEEEETVALAALKVNAASENLEDAKATLASAKKKKDKKKALAAIAVAEAHLATAHVQHDAAAEAAAQRELEAAQAAAEAAAEAEHAEADEARAAAALRAAEAAEAAKSKETARAEAHAKVEELEVTLAGAKKKKQRKQLQQKLADAQLHLETARVAHDEAATVAGEKEVEEAEAAITARQAQRNRSDIAQQGQILREKPAASNTPSKAPTKQNSSKAPRQSTAGGVIVGGAAVVGGVVALSALTADDDAASGPQLPEGLAELQATEWQEEQQKQDDSGGLVAPLSPTSALALRASAEEFVPKWLESSDASLCRLILAQSKNSSTIPALQKLLQLSVPPPRHKYADRNSEMTEIYIRF